MIPSLSMSAICRISAWTASYAAISSAYRPCEPGDRLAEGQVEVGLHHRLHVGERPVVGVGAAEEGGDVVAVGIPAGRRVGLFRRLAGPRVGDDLRSGQDVGPQQRGELVAGVIAIEGLDGVADIDLVGEQAVGRGPDVRQVGGAGGGADDVQPGPGDVVLPQLAHRIVEGRAGEGRCAGFRAGPTHSAQPPPRCRAAGSMRWRASAPPGWLRSGSMFSSLSSSPDGRRVPAGLLLSGMDTYRYTATGRAVNSSHSPRFR